MGKQKGKSAREGAKQPADQRNAGAAAPTTSASGNAANYLGSSDLLHAQKVVAGTEWERPLAVLLEYLTGLAIAVTNGDAPTCERLVQELLNRQEHSTLLTCIPSLGAEALNLVTAIIGLADGRVPNMDVESRRLLCPTLGKALSPEEPRRSEFRVWPESVPQPEVGPSEERGTLVGSVPRDPLLRVMAKLHQAMLTDRLYRAREWGEVIPGAETVAVERSQVSDGGGVTDGAASDVGVFPANISEGEPVRLSSIRENRTLSSRASSQRDQETDVPNTCVFGAESRLDLQSVAQFPFPASAAMHELAETAISTRGLFWEALEKLLSLVPDKQQVADTLAKFELLKGDDELPYLLPPGFGHPIWSVAINERFLELWEGAAEEERAIGTIATYSAPGPWEPNGTEAFTGPKTSYPLLEAAGRLLELLIGAANWTWVAGVDSRMVPAPLLPLVAALAQPLGKSMPPGFFRRAAEAGAALLTCLREYSGTDALERTLKALGQLRIELDSSLRLAELLAASGFGTASGGAAETETIPKGNEKGGVRRSHASKGDAGRAKRHGKGDAIEDGAGEREKEETLAAAAEEAAYGHYESTFVEKEGCATLAEKVAVLATGMVFNEPESRSVTLAGLETAAAISNLLASPAALYDVISGCVVAAGVHFNDVQLTTQALSLLSSLNVSQVTSQRHRELLWQSVATLMLINPERDAVQRHGCTILHALGSCPDSPEVDLLGRIAVVTALERFPSDVRIQFLGGKVLIAAPRDIAYFGGIRALAGAMRLCSSNQAFLVSACQTLGTLHKQCPLAAGSKYAAEKRAAHQKARQQQGLDIGATLATLFSAQRVYFADRPLTSLADFVAEERLRAITEGPVLLVGKTVPDVKTEERDWAEGLGAILSALEASPKSARVQEAGLAELRRWGFVVKGCDGPGPGEGSEQSTWFSDERVNRIWNYGGAPQFPNCPELVDANRSGVLGDHFLLARSLTAAATALESLPHDARCSRSALATLKELFRLARLKFDIAGWAQELGKPSEKLSTSASEGAPVPEDIPPGEVVPGSRNSTRGLRNDEAAWAHVLQQMTTAFSAAFKVFRSLLDEGRNASSPTFLESSRVVPLIAADYAALANTFCSDVEIFFQSFPPETPGASKDMNQGLTASADIDAQEGREPPGGSDGSGAAREPLSGEGSLAVFAKDAARLAKPLEIAGLQTALESVLRAFALFLHTRTDVDEKLQHTVVKAVRSLFTLRASEVVQGDEKTGNGLRDTMDPKPFGMDPTECGVSSLVSLLMDGHNGLVEADRAGSTAALRRAAVEIEAVIGALAPALKIPAVRSGLSSEPWTDESPLRVLLQVMGLELTTHLDTLPINEAVTLLFTECPEVSVFATRQRFSLIEAFLRTWGQQASGARTFPGYVKHFGCYAYLKQVAVRVILRVLRERGGPTNTNLLNRILALRRGGVLSTAPLIVAVDKGDRGRDFWIPPSEGSASRSSAPPSSEGKVLYRCHFAHFMQQGEMDSNTPKVLKRPPPDGGYCNGIQPLSKEAFEELCRLSTEGDRTRTGRCAAPAEGDPLPGWDSAFWILVLGDSPFDQSNLLWAGMVADPEHGPQFARELLASIHYTIQPGSSDRGYYLRLTSQLYVIIEHQLRHASDVWVAAAEQSRLCWAVLSGTWGKVLDGLGKGGGEDCEREGDLLRDGCSLLVAFHERIPLTCTTQAPLRIREAFPKLSKAPDTERVWLLQCVCSDVLKVYGAYGTASEGSAPTEGIPSPDGGDWFEGPRRPPRKDVRAAARQVLALAQQLHEKMGRPGWMPASEKLLLAHDAAAEGDSKSLQVCTKEFAAMRDRHGRTATWYRDFYKQPVLMPGERTGPDWMKEAVPKDPRMSKLRTELVRTFETEEARRAETGAQEITGGAAGAEEETRSEGPGIEVVEVKGVEDEKTEKAGKGPRGEEDKGAGAKATEMGGPERKAAAKRAKKAQKKKKKKKGVEVTGIELERDGEVEEKAGKQAGEEAESVVPGAESEKTGCDEPHMEADGALAARAVADDTSSSGLQLAAPLATVTAPTDQETSSSGPQPSTPPARIPAPPSTAPPRRPPSPPQLDPTAVEPLVPAVAESAPVVVEPRPRNQTPGPARGQPSPDGRSALPEQEGDVGPDRVTGVAHQGPVPLAPQHQPTLEVLPNASPEPPPAAPLSQTSRPESHARIPASPSSPKPLLHPLSDEDTSIQRLPHNQATVGTPAPGDRQSPPVPIRGAKVRNVAAHAPEGLAGQAELPTNSSPASTFGPQFHTPPISQLSRRQNEHLRPPSASPGTSRPRAPYNPLTRTGSLIGQTAPPEIQTQTVEPQAAAATEIASEYAVDELLSLLTGNTLAVPLDAQRPPSPEPDSCPLPSILSMLLPSEGGGEPGTSSQPTAAVTPQVPSAYRPEVRTPLREPDSTRSSHVAVNSWPEGSINAPGATTVPEPLAAAGEKRVTPSVAKEKAKVDKMRDDDVCCICFDNPKNGALVPCGHRLCLECSNMIHERRGECPLCNTKIQIVLKLFN